MKNKDGYSSEAFNYHDFLEDCRSLCVEFLNRDPTRATFGTHIMRKTAYLFAIWGVLKEQSSSLEAVEPLCMAAIMKSARHSALCNAGTYAKDSISLFEWCRRTRSSINNDVCTWRDIHIESSEPFVATTVQSRVYQGTLSEVSEWYFRKFLLLVDDSLLTVQDFLNVAFQRKPEESAEKQLLGKLHSHVPPAYLNELLELLQAYKREMRESLALSTTPTMGNTKKPPPTDIGKDIIPSTKTSSCEKKRTRVAGTVDLDDRRDIKHLKTGHEQLEAILNIYGMVGEKNIYMPNDLTDAARKYYYNTCVKYYRCLNDCHQGDMTQLLKQFPDQKPLLSKYKGCEKCGKKIIS